MCFFAICSTWRAGLMWRRKGRLQPPCVSARFLSTETPGEYRLHVSIQVPTTTNIDGRSSSDDVIPASLAAEWYMDSWIRRQVKPLLCDENCEASDLIASETVASGIVVRSRIITADGSSSSWSSKLRLSAVDLPLVRAVAVAAAGGVVQLHLTAIVAAISRARRRRPLCLPSRSRRRRLRLR